MRKELWLPPETQKEQIKKAARVFRAYLKETNLNETFEDLSSTELDELLGRFYLNARQVDGSFYKVSSLENFRHTLNRYLSGPPHNRDFDI